MGTIFLSYPSAERELADVIYNQLKQSSHTICWDKDVAPGEPFDTKLKELLAQSDVVVFLISQNTQNAPGQLAEIGYARALASSREGMGLVPVVFDQVRVPFDLASVRAIYSSRIDVTEAVSEVLASVNYYQGLRAAGEKAQQEAQQRIQANAATFIKETFDFLRARENNNKWIAYFCYVGGLAALFAGVIVGWQYTSTVPSGKVDLMAVILAFKGLVVIGLLVGISKYAFNLGKAFMNESLRNSDRFHAIKFGEFYLNAFGDKATWDQLKEVFQTWNIDSTSTFAKLDASDYDPKFLETVVAVAKVVGANKEKAKVSGKE